ncbi:hypothetical protein KFU94_51470 [Chloroflexi bacterium TSY]|nr:hypothetical protein [Chloroflexi bacterium TSY]
MAPEKIDFTHFARLVVDALEEIGLDYLIGGAVAVWAWGAPRSTQDLDVVINLPGNRIVQLSHELEKRDMLVPPEIIIDLLLQPEGDLPINAIHLHTGHKAEFFLLRADDTYREMALARRRLVDLGPPLGEVYVHAPEDLILNKVRYFAISEQSKHVRDIASMIVLLDDELDLNYINDWVEQLQLTDTWYQIQQQISAPKDS